MWKKAISWQKKQHPATLIALKMISPIWPVLPPQTLMRIPACYWRVSYASIVSNALS